ncbi:NAD(P)/FAD-dependent oxidoreductase [Lichenicoccus sp.]|uniref:NAD(P)/FAD-dependent oxidoreductase n=1 Tax=Lichenicoccus sp. TaxID=2781899 RepID=UPI003D14F145
MRIAIVGAGMAGLACAQALRGHAVTLFDKGRRPGGRLATRRVEGLMFDHGAQYATARGSAFQAFIEQAGDLVAPWDPAVKHPRWVGVPGMSAFARAAEHGGIGSLHLQCQIRAITRDAEAWHLHHDGGSAGPFDRIVLALPAPQAAPLLAAIGHPFAARVGAVAMQPCWCLMLAFSERQSGPDTRTLEGGALAWIARDSSRPGRDPLPDCWIAHAGPDWSQAHLEDPPDQVEAALRTAFAEATEIRAVPHYAAVHRWRYARTQSPLGEACLWDPSGMAVCGDWCLAGKVEAAFDSGLAAAAACA